MAQQTRFVIKTAPLSLEQTAEKLQVSRAHALAIKALVNRVAFYSRRKFKRKATPLSFKKRLAKPLRTARTKARAHVVARSSKVGLRSR